MRLFQPKAGFHDGHTIGIDDDGMSHVVTLDGKKQSAHTINDATKQAIPIWTLGELENAVKDGSWIEVTEGRPAQLTSQVVTTAQQPQHPGAPTPVKPTPPLQEMQQEPKQ